MSEEQYRVKVIDTDYDKDRQLIKWLVQNVHTDVQFTLAWRDSDLGKQFNIQKQLPEYVIEQFCEDMKNKEFNLVMNSDIQQHDADWFKNEENVDQVHETLDQFPYKEVLEQIEEQSLKLRVFGLDDCSKCQKICEELQSADMPYYYYDAESSENESFCDKNGVDEVPHIQIVDNNENVLFEHIGYISPSEIRDSVASQ